MRVLLCDDDRVQTHLLSIRLRARGVEIVVAYDAMQVIMVAMRAVPDAIVLDLQMPGGNGVDALKKLKLSAKTSPIPVIVLSGSGGADTPAEVMSLGAERFLLKPVDPDELYRVLTEIARGAAPGR